jgi:hypothetical protein
MGQLIDLMARQFGWLTVIARAKNTGVHRLSLWDCICKCGNTLIVRSDALRNGSTRSCGNCSVEYRLRGIFTTTDRRGTTWGIK